MDKIISIIVRTADFLIDKISQGLKEVVLFIKQTFNLSKYTKVKNHYKTSKKRLFVDILLVGMTLAFLGLAFILVWAVSLKTPSPDSFDDRLLGQSAKIYDRTGKILLYDLSQKVRRAVVPFDKISPFIKKATIAIEDETFYEHGGIQAKSIIRAILANIMTLRFSQGGSTITQQVVKNSLLSNDKSISRKIKEWILSIKLEQVTDKDTILNMYLNSSPYGGNIYGVGEATQNFFGKKPDEVTLAESAYIAALPQSPTSLSPYGKNTTRLEDRKNNVLKKMLELKLINQEEFDAAMKEKVVFQPKSLAGIKAAHFVMYIKDYLENKYGDDMLQNGGLKIITTLDYDLQQKAEEIIKKYVIDNEKKFKASNGGIVAVDPKTGQILTMVGSRDYFDKDIQGNFNIATAHRQPGSAFKPFVYATAFNQGYLPETPVFDVSTEFNSGCTEDGVPISGTTAKCYHPQNYSLNYKGLMSFRQALGASQNIPAVKVLYLVGVDTAIKTARDMGIEGLSDANQYGLSLALGGAEVSLLDITSAYGVFGNNGAKNHQTGILSVTTADGQALESFDSQAKLAQQVIPEQTAFAINDVLSDKYARNSIFTLSYTGDRQVAIKTGTTNNSRDAWTIGYTPSVSIGAWMGNNDNTPMAQIASALIVSPMWKQFLDYALTKVPVEQFEKPTYDTADKKPFITGTWHTDSGEVHSELYWINRADPMGPPPSNPNADPGFRLWEGAVVKWAGTTGKSLIPVPVGTPTTSNAFSVSVGSSMFVPKNLQTTASVYNYPASTVKVDYFINGENIGSSNQPPFSIFFTPSTIKSVQDENELKATAFDALGGHIEASGFFSTN